MDKQKRILIVDDDPDILEAVQYVLDSMGYEVVTNTGESVVNSVHSTHPNLVLLDVMLPDKDGREICKRLKSDSKTKYLPIIMFSAMSDSKRQMLSCGSEDFIAKPFDMEELVQKVQLYT